MNFRQAPITSDNVMLLWLILSVVTAYLMQREEEVTVRPGRNRVRVVAFSWARFLVALPVAAFLWLLPLH